MPHRYRFGRVEVRPAERLLLVDGRAVMLGSRAFDVLIALVEHRDRLVTKSELLDLVWPGLVVEENNLAVQVVALRKALGPQAIATVPGRGYRFAMALDDEPDTATPPPAAAAASAGGLVALPALGSLFGRADDVASLDQLLSRSRLVTVVGSGGIGKTSLALAAAHSPRAVHRDGVGWVDLAEVADPSLLPRTVAQAVGLPMGVGDDQLQALVLGLSPLRLLLVLDNAEHLVEAVARLCGAVLASAPDVQLLVTSQAALKIDAERLFRLGPLGVPEPDAGVSAALAHGAVALFADRAQAADRQFELTEANVGAVIGLCRQLDGVALAIKLAAARLPMLGLQGLTARLGERLKLLGGARRDAPVRQQTLQAALDWSHGLLKPVEQAVFRRLGVFAGGFALDHVAAVVSDAALDEWTAIEALVEIVDRSLVAADGAEVPRYRLPEVARAYARLKLDEAQERETLQQRHAQATAALMDGAYASYWTLPDGQWLARFAPEVDNVRAALDWATPQQPELACRLIGASGILFMHIAHAAEARRRFAALEPHLDRVAATMVVARYWLERSRLHWAVSNVAMCEFALRAASLYRSAGDAQGLLLALRCAAGSDAMPSDEAIAMVAEMTALERPDWPVRLHAQRLLAESSVLRTAGRAAESRTVDEALLRLAHSAGLDAVALSALAGLARGHLALGDPGEAARCARRLLEHPGARRGNLVLLALGTLAEALLLQGRVGEARAALVEFVALSRSREGEWLDLYANLFALLAAGEGRIEDAARLTGYADTAAAVGPAGDRGVSARRIREHVAALIDGALDPETIRGLMAEGARLDAQTARLLALGDEAGRTM